MVVAWFIAGVLLGAGATLVSTSGRARAIFVTAQRRPWLLGAALLLVLVTATYVMYARLAPRDTTLPVASAAQSMDHPAGSPAQSMDAAVAGLEARLAAGGGSDADWALLAQSYDFLGRADDARRARQHLIGKKTASLSATAMSAASAALDGQRVPAASAAGTPRVTSPQSTQDPQSWLMLADARRAQRDFAGARDAYEKAIARQEMTAQAWADYADTLASLDGGSLNGPAAAAIDRALALDAANVKALWLKASQAHEQREYSAALVWWKKLKDVLPRDSSDARIIEGNIAEDGALAGAPAQSRAAASSAAGPGMVSGTVSVDDRYASRVGTSAVLFIYAKAADSPGPPLAVLRTAVATWPVAFRLDDTLAMLPSRKLSQFDKVIVEARISRSGQAMPASGDLYTTSAVVHPAEGRKLALVIDHEIG